MTPETKFRHKFNTKLESSGAMTFKIVGGLMQKPGWPDMIVISSVFFGFVELKANNNTPSKLQIWVARQLFERNVPVLFISVDAAWEGVRISNYEKELGYLPYVDFLRTSGFVFLTWMKEWWENGKL